MSTRNLASIDGSKGSNTYVDGDYDPSDFDYNKAVSRDELLSMLIRNGKIQKATVWTAGEMMRERWKFSKEQPIKAPKHTIEKFPFPTFNEWLEWIGAMEEILKVLFWSLNFGESIVVCFTGKETYEGKVLTLAETTDPIVKIKAYYPMVKGSGYIIKDVDPVHNIPGTYKIKLNTFKASNRITIMADKSRVVRFSAPSLELKYAGTSNVSAIVKDCIAQEQIKRGVVAVANNLLPGILACKASNDDEVESVNNAIGDALTHLRRIYFKNIEDMDGLLKIIIPDMKVQQIESFNTILQNDISAGADIQKSIMEGAGQGTISTAGYDTFNTYSKIKQLQAHYKRAMEQLFFKLGKLDTAFTWNDPTPAPPTNPEVEKTTETPKKESEETEETTEDKEDEVEE